VITSGTDGKPHASYTVSGRTVQNSRDSNNQPITKAAGFRHFGNSDQVSATQRHYKDSRGVEGTSYRKALGDSSREVFVHRESNGTQHTRDYLQGISSDNLERFDTEWSNRIHNGN